MSDELISLKMLIVSGVPGERDLIRRAASEASIPIEVVETDPASDAAEARALLQDGGFDLVFSDSRIPKSIHLKLIEAIRAAKERPLSILIGPAGLKTRAVLTDGLPIDSVLGKPIEPAEVRRLLDGCARASPAASLSSTIPQPFAR
jgi:CheY-like chemotaxis protein